MTKTKSKAKKTRVDFSKVNSIGDYEVDQEKYNKSVANQKWKLGDWCICEMEIKQITGIDKDTGLPHTVSCGYFSSGCRDWTPHLFPLTLSNKNIATYFRTLYDELHKKNRNLNFPDLNRYFWQKCDECLSVSDNKEEVEKLCNEISQFQRQIIAASDEVMERSINGVEIFRR